ncbi:Glutamate--tRNA ligase [Candidatus Desulfarcum epimagneticum]|uniref:Glutamate--tRNA ligase n=1 Tax=uncultured Desulfobacteraceae bacterium TaxID=218296 RepID=A0A484HNQ7_9BACT|nr:Glutamate--tRNA ligase [uncultured Desulfobacteraceae bacterium]
MTPIITRFPPSPTGHLHVGGARTALFNWLLARHFNGKFVLRIEDTDRARSTEASADAILESLEWLGIDWDEGPWFQSERMPLYREYVDRLLKDGMAYHCDCSKEDIDAMRKKAMAAGEKPRYDGTCRNRGLEKSPGSVVRFAAPSSGSTAVKDIVKGGVVFSNQELDDFVILRSDQTPTYNFVVVVDDIEMGITTVVRGDDHLNNTPKQIQLYRALGAEVPDFAHVPMVLGADRTRLSKRHGAMSVTAYRDMGFLPDALINYLVRLGWSHGDQEFFTRKDLIEVFTLENIGTSAGIFDPEKLKALNADHIKAAPPSELVAPLSPFLERRGFPKKDDSFVEKAIATLNSRSKTLDEMAEAAEFYFLDKVSYEEKAARKNLKPGAAPVLAELIQRLEALEDFTEENLETAFKAVMESTGLKLGKIAQPARVALTGKTVSPGIFEIIEVLGREKSLERLRLALGFIEGKEKES